MYCCHLNLYVFVWITHFEFHVFYFRYHVLTFHLTITGQHDL